MPDHYRSFEVVMNLGATAPLDIDGRPRFAKRSIGNVKKVKIAAIDPDLIEAEAFVPDGMR